MAKEYKVPIKQLVDAAIEAKKGKIVTIDIGDGKPVAAEITEIKDDFVTLTVK